MSVKSTKNVTKTNMKLSIFERLGEPAERKWSDADNEVFENFLRKQKTVCKRTNEMEIVKKISEELQSKLKYEINGNDAAAKMH